jgi:hypothetical protein
MRFTLYRFHCSIVVFCWVNKHILYLLRDAKIITEIHHFEKKILLSTQNNSKLLYFQEVELFTNSLNQLKHAQGKFVECKVLMKSKLVSWFYRSYCSLLWSTLSQVILTYFRALQFIPAPTSPWLVRKHFLLASQL